MLDLPLYTQAYAPLPTKIMLSISAISSDGLHSRGCNSELLGQVESSELLRASSLTGLEDEAQPFKVENLGGLSAVAGLAL